MDVFTTPSTFFKVFVITLGGKPFKIYGQPYTVYASCPLFWQIPLIRFIEAKYITITLPSAGKGFLWLWYHLNGITPTNDLMNKLGLTFDERIELWNLVKLFGMEENQNIIFSFVDSVMIGVTPSPEKILELPSLLWDTGSNGFGVRGFRALPVVHPGVREVDMFNTEYARHYLSFGKNRIPFPSIPIFREKGDTAAHILMWIDDEGLERYYITPSSIPLLPLVVKKAEDGDLVQMAKALPPDKVLNVVNFAPGGTLIPIYSDRKGIERRMRYGSREFNMYSTGLDSLVNALALSGITINQEMVDEITRTTRGLVMGNLFDPQEIHDTIPRFPPSKARLQRQPSTPYAIMYRATADIGEIKEGSTVYVLSGYELSPDTWSVELDNPSVPSLPREIYHYPLPSMFKFRIGPYLLEGSPITIKSRSPYFEAYPISEWTAVTILKDEVVDWDAIVYVWSYLNGITDDYSRPHYSLSYTSLLQCWKYISYFQIPLVSMFVDDYITMCFRRAPKHKDEGIYNFLKEINDRNPSNILGPDLWKQGILNVLRGVKEDGTE